VCLRITGQLVKTGCNTTGFSRAGGDPAVCTSQKFTSDVQLIQGPNFDSHCTTTKEVIPNHYASSKSSSTFT